MCVQLAELGCTFVPSSYYEARSRPPSARTMRDETLKTVIAAEYDDNYRVYGARKMWLHLRGMGIDVGPLHRGTPDEGTGSARGLPRQGEAHDDRRSGCWQGEGPGEA